MQHTHATYTCNIATHACNNYFLQGPLDDCVNYTQQILATYTCNTATHPLLQGNPLLEMAGRLAQVGLALGHLLILLHHPRVLRQLLHDAPGTRSTLRSGLLSTRRGGGVITDGVLVMAITNREGLGLAKLFSYNTADKK